MSAPFINEVFEFPQPDGTTIRVRGSGDQFHARFETLDGTPLTRTEDGFFVEAPAAAPATLAATAAGQPDHELTSPLLRKRSRWRQRRKDHKRPGSVAALSAPAPPSHATVGTFVGLTLLIDFADDPATISQAEVQNFCNQPGYTGFGNNGSVFDYFRDISGNRLLYTNIVAPYYRARKPKSHYADLALSPKTRRNQFTKRAQELIREALAHHIANGFNFAALTADRGNHIYALNVFYAGARVNAWSEGLWPHQSTLSPKVKLPDRRIFADYQITDMGSELTLGTFCHENGHMICDFPDLYQYSGTGRGAGNYCLMCFGGAGANAKNPVHVGAYLKNEAGWGTAMSAAPGSLSLGAGSNRFVIHQRSATEYFIIENRQRLGRDAGLPSEGLAIWHVDERASNTTARPHYECALVQADNLLELERGTNDGDPRDLFSSLTKADFAATSTPASRWRNGKPSGLSIDQIGAPGATMSFRVS